MSAAAETVVDAVPARKKGGRKLIVIIALAVLLAGAGGAAAWVVKQKRDAAAAQADAEADGEGDEDAGAGAGSRRPEHADAHRVPPAFLPLDVFVVNLADRDSERFAQIGVTLELDNAKSADELKAYMPAIRNGILMVLAHKTSQELLTREGKERLAAEIMRESVRPLGIESPEPRPAKEGAGRAGAATAEAGPVRHVHFSSFIMQ
jgi:flagellar FliL protein